MARILVACEYSARVRDAFRARGHDAWSCDLLPTDGNPTWHLQRDVALALAWGNWDCLVAFPPCTYLTTAGARYWNTPEWRKNQPIALAFVRALMDAPVKHIAIENPQGAIGTNIRRADQVIQPWQFGDPWVKRTCLWLTHLPALAPDNEVVPAGSWVDGGARGMVAPRGRVRNPHKRSLTFPGVARAMADQWGGYLDSLSTERAA